MSNYTTIEPTVIDEEILRKAVNDQVNPEIGDVARKEGIEFSEVTCLRLDYKNILKIDNLWAFENLTKLQLDNNIIERIENINFLKNLQWLDLSFNNISVIEGLEGLTKLTDLTLFNNRISKIENLDDLVNLNILSIGNNNLNVLEDLTYLTKFEHLRVLNAAGNAICKNPNYKHYVLAHVRHLKYLDYRLVDEESVAAAREKYMDDLIALEEEEKIANAKKEESVKTAELESIYSAAHIGGIDHLFQNMFKDDPDFQKIIPIAKDIIAEHKEEYFEKFQPVIEELKEFALRKHHEQQMEVAMFEECKKNAKHVHNQECLDALNAYQHLKKQIFRSLHEPHNRDLDVDESLKRLRDETQRLSDKLMSHEMQLVEQFEDVIKEFERSYGEFSTSITEFGQNSFARLREMENEFQERLSEGVMASFDRYNKGDLDDIDDELRDLMSDKDALVNAVNSSHDFRLGKLDQQEDLLVAGINKTTEQFTQRMHDEEVKRNRTRVCEIISFLDKCQSEIEQLEES